MTVGCPPSDYTALGSNHRRLSAPARLVGRSLRRASSNEYYALRCGRPTSGYPQYISLGIHFRCCALSLRRSGKALRLGDGVLTALSKGHHGNIYKGAGLPTGGSQMPPGTNSRDPRPKNTGPSGPPNCNSVFFDRVAVKEDLRPPDLSNRRRARPGIERTTLGWSAGLSSDRLWRGVSNEPQPKSSDPRCPASVLTPLPRDPNI